MRRFLYIGVFTAGLAVMAVELSASRLLGNYFGSSNLVWAAIIGLMLIYLSIGYSLGGKWADRSPKHATFFGILIWAGFFIGLIPVISRPILRFASQAFDQLQSASMIGSFATVLILFSIPITLLGTASPFAVRLAIRDEKEAGSVAGKIYTISTVGSFLGTFLPVLLLIPLIGTYRTFITISLFVLLIGLIGLGILGEKKHLLIYLLMPLLVILLALVGFRGYDKQAEGIVYEGESVYNYIQVQKINDYHLLRLNEGQGIHSIAHPTQVDFHGPWEQVLSAIFFNPAPVLTADIDRIAILGLAAGTSANQINYAFPHTVVDGYEIDPEIVTAGIQYFGLSEDNVNIFIDDARWGITHNDHLYEVISIDAYTPPYIPWHLTTREFFTTVANRLTPDGVMVINVARIFEDRELLNTLYATIDTVFENAYVVDLPGTLNSMIFATKAQTHPDNLIANYIHLSAQDDTPQILLSTIETTYLNLQPPPAKGIVLTDDKAPIEWITNAMIINLFFSEDLKYLQ
jgi:spermidine synthase